MNEELMEREEVDLVVRSGISDDEGFQSERKVRRMKIIKSSSVGRKKLIRQVKADNRGMGTVEVILIIVVLVGLVIIFKDQIGGIVSSLFSKITSQTGSL